LIRILFDILRLRAGPQDLPAGAGLAILLSVAWLAQGLLTDQLLDETDSAPRSLFAVLVQFGAVFALLKLRNRSARIPQTISALAGTGFIFGLLALLLVLQLDPQQPKPGLALAYLGLFVWSLVVDGHIYRHALSIKMSLGVLVAVLIFAVNYTLMRAVFG
jgi:peptidoglycan/LPS O-acetylase OafA/YrhL